jgi:hypothetical protein
VTPAAVTKPPGPHQGHGTVDRGHRTTSVSHGQPSSPLNGRERRDSRSLGRPIAPDTEQAQVQTCGGHGATQARRARALLSTSLHRRHAGDPSLPAPVRHETYAWGIPGAWSNGQQGHQRFVPDTLILLFISRNARCQSLPLGRFFPDTETVMGAAPEHHCRHH